MENNSIDLKVGYLTLDIFREGAGSNVSIKEQWENMERIFEMVKASIVEREREIEVRERGVRDVERLLSEVKVREREIDERGVVLDEREREIDEREHEIDERGVVLAEREKEIDERSVMLEERGKEFDERRVVLEAWEKEINEGGGVLDEREREIDERRTMLEEREQEIDERRVVLVEREKEIHEREVVLEEREKEIDERRVVLQEREREIDEKSAGLAEREREIDERGVVFAEREREIDERVVVLEEREKEIDERGVVLEEREKEFDERRVVLEERERGSDERSVVLEAWEKEINEGGGLLDEREREIDERRTVLEEREQEFGVVSEEREKEIDERRAVLEEREREIVEKSIVLEAWEKEISEKNVVLEEREKEISEKSVVLEEREKEIDKKSVVFNEREKEIGEKSVVLAVREEEINKKAVVLEEREWLLLRNKENLQFTHKNLIEGQRLSNLRERKVVEICKDMELTEARINEGWASLKVEVGVEFKEMETSEGSESRIDQLFKSMDVNGVLSYVIENETELNVCQETLLDYLRLAPTPGKLVLKVIQSFHELGLVNSHGFNGRIGCINLLVGLMKLEEEISASVRKEAEIFAANLGSSVVRQDCSPLDVLCFVQFVVSFKLYDADEILMFLQAFCVGREACWPDENTMSHYELGLSMKLTALVQYLISREKHLEAVIYICAFKMEDSFLLEPLLDAHFKTIRKTAQETVSEASSSAHQDDAVNKELTAVTNMHKVISYFKLEPNSSANSVGLFITQLEKELRNPKVMAKISTVKIEKN